LAAGGAIVDIERLCTEFGQQRDVERLLQVTDKAVGIDDVLRSPAIESSRDPVVKQLSSALNAAVDDRLTEMYANALRLAIFARLQYLTSEAQPSHPYAYGIGAGSADRQTRALQKWRLKRVVEYVDDHLADKLTLSDLAGVAGLSRMHFAAQFRAATGRRPHEYLLRRRIQRSEELLCQSTMPLVEVALTVGFQTQAHFTTVFKRIVGDTPHQWRSRTEPYVSPSAATEPTLMPGVSPSLSRPGA
jgi:AraC-like DNA-binding protein